ncbi:hypothetical protein F5Y18DRAFT_429374 [Xylariaceae sp. FL1019]|nr:hypothetical protein F5Y18DRAFT_429374 [Xylariaceae sp. FL1019]
MIRIMLGRRRPYHQHILPNATFTPSNARLFSNRSTTFYWIAADQPTFVPDVNWLFAMGTDGTIDVKICNTWDMDDIREAHKQWDKGSGAGSNLIRISKV